MPLFFTLKILSNKGNYFLLHRHFKEILQQSVIMYVEIEVEVEMSGIK